MPLRDTLYPTAPSPPEDLLWPGGDSPCLAAQFTLSRLAAIHLVPQGTLSCLTAIHLVPQGTLSSRGPSPPEDLLSPVGDSPCLAAQFTLSCLTAIHLVPQGTLSCLTAIHLVPQGTLSCLTAIHLVPQGTFSSRGPSPPGDLLLQRTFSRLAAIHLVLLRNSPCLAWRRFTLSCYAIHLVSPDGNSPFKYTPVRKYITVRSTAASLGNCSCTPSKGPTFGALPSPIPGLVRPTVPQACVDQLVYPLVCLIARLIVEPVHQVFRQFIGVHIFFRDHFVAYRYICLVNTVRITTDQGVPVEQGFVFRQQPVGTGAW